MRRLFLQFTRRLHVLREHLEKTPTEELLTISEKPLPWRAKGVRLEDKGRLVATETKHQVLERLGPLSYLEKVSTNGLTYRISQLRDVEAEFKGGASKLPGHNEELYITTVCSKATLKHNLSRAYHFLSHGSRVEFHLRQAEDENIQNISWALKNALHVRPDIINAAMPMGTEQLLAPIQLGRDLIWVLEHKKNREKALEIEQSLAPIKDYTDLIVALKYEVIDENEFVRQEKAYLTVYPIWKEVGDGKPPKMRAQLILGEAEASRIFPSRVKKSTVEPESQELEDQGIHDDGLLAEIRRNVPEPSSHQLEDQEGRSDTTPITLSSFHMSNKREHVRPQNDVSIEKSVLPNPESSDEFASTIISYCPSKGKSGEKRISLSESQKSRKMPSSPMQKDVVAESNLEFKATVSSDREIPSYVAVEPAQTDISANHDARIEGSTSSMSERPHDATSDVQRKHFSMGRYYARVFKPEERLESFVRRTWKSP